jgi:tetratricopeptide (TPR) repeat protein
MTKLACLIIAAASLVRADDVNTFSIVAFDPETRQWGVTVASRYFSVGSVVPWAEAEIGAVATQANVNVGYGPKGLELLRQGLSAKAVLDKLLAEDTFPGKDGRQVAIIDKNGNIAAFTGKDAPNWAGNIQGKTWSAQGNILVGPQVPAAMGKAFEATKGDLAEKLFAALKAGDDAGGDSRGKQSASMLVVQKGGGRNINNDRLIYLNVDDSPAPIPELRRLLDMNQATLYQGKLGGLLSSGDMKGARDVAEKLIRYSPNQAGSHMNYGMISYLTGDKTVALSELRKARELNPQLKQQLENMTRNRAQYAAVLKDEEFMKQVFQ